MMDGSHQDLSPEEAYFSEAFKKWFRMVAWKRTATLLVTPFLMFMIPYFYLILEARGLPRLILWKVQGYGMNAIYWKELFNGHLSFLLVTTILMVMSLTFLFKAVSSIPFDPKKPLESTRAFWKSASLQKEQEGVHLARKKIINYLHGTLIGSTYLASVAILYMTLFFTYVDLLGAIFTMKMLMMTIILLLACGSGVIVSIGVIGGCTVSSIIGGVAGGIANGVASGILGGNIAEGFIIGSVVGGIVGGVVGGVSGHATGDVVAGGIVGGITSGPVVGIASVNMFVGITVSLIGGAVGGGIALLGGIDGIDHFRDFAIDFLAFESEDEWRSVILYKEISAVILGTPVSDSQARKKLHELSLSSPQSVLKHFKYHSFEEFLLAIKTVERNKKKKRD